ncbi:Mu transposase C-terminal domain-containing protein [Shigella flexneri]|uniref:Transposase n=4 Tax=Shigella flexneri TaxID=623 RepID=A0A4P7TJF2_SHIFM|nr:Mu transposase C-terminal domain-containing protein [Shigella flexneri]ABF04848.1 putative phage transposase [Shigella flexneri 5 str. 8401]EFZ2446110.1 DDE-type integrase/transposase/recombinase [Shigella flexneri]EFZ2466923.1 DDE-type integrase/transposase/recombinase [Shigella flexneri]EGD4841099.1 transposase [Shigella flexneri]EGM3936394.1 DDE-type integrase/transposase/recombinase [Shigella flexneri]
MQSYVTVNDLLGVPGMPATTKGIRQALQRFSRDLGDVSRRREGTKAIEYHIDYLPEITRKALRERYVEQLVATENNVSEVKAVTRKTRNPDAVQAIEAYRGSPQLMEERLNALTENQRWVSEARAALVVEVLKLESAGNLGRLKAINFLVEKARKGELPERLQQAAVNANAKRGANRTISRDPLYQWVLKYNQSQNAAERLLLLAPGKRDEIKPEEISWLPEFLAQYRQVNGRPMSEAYEDFVAEWQRRHADEPYMLEVMPSYDVVRYAMKKLPEVVKQKGRVTGSEYRQLEGFTRRDWTAMPVNYVWIGDGHGMKLKCAHPIHGRPFSPEVTFVIDGGTRFVVGWSLDLAENVFAVAGAIQHGIRNHGKPFLYYSDNGSGETADMLDKEVVGILPRLGIKHPTGIAGNPQGRGIIERLNRTLPMRIARRYRTYFGKGADRESLRVLNRDLRSAFNALQQDKPLNDRQKAAMRELPSWAELIEAIREGVEWYNNRPHSELPMKPNGRHYSPTEFRKKRQAEEDTEIEWLNNIYYAPELRDEHGRKVLISYDIHDAERITVRRKDGSFICEAIWNGNKRAAFAVSAEYHKQQQRIKGMRKRAEEKIRDAEDEGIQILEHKQAEPWLSNVYRPVGNVVAVQQPEYEEEHDEEFERDFRLGMQKLFAMQEEDDPLA